MAIKILDFVIVNVFEFTEKYWATRSEKEQYHPPSPSVVLSHVLYGKLAMEFGVAFLVSDDRSNHYICQMNIQNL